MSEFEPRPKQYFEEADDLKNFNIRQLSGPRVLHADSNFEMYEYIKCNRRQHWREVVTINHMDGTSKITDDAIRTACSCSD